MRPPPKHAYTYIVLRYMHDITAGEFLNVGVVLMAPELDFIGAKFRTNYGRIKKIFPTLDGEAYRRRVRGLQTAFDRIARRDVTIPETIARSNKSSLNDVVQLVLPQDDSSFQWSPIGSGISAKPELALERIFRRFVSKHDDENSNAQRKDEDVWKFFRTELEKRNVLGHLEEKIIAVEDDSIKFSHAWKNGAWNCYEPLSFDLSSDSSIKEKAHRWLGQVSSVKSAQEKFHVFFLVGKPRNASLQDAYIQAISILRKTPKSEVVEEGDAEAFSVRVAAAIERHESSDF